MIDKDVQASIDFIIETCPTHWNKVGELLKDLSIARPCEHERLDYAYIEKSTIVMILQKLGFEP